MKRIQIVMSHAYTNRIKEWLISAVVGALLACLSIYYFVSTDKALQKLDAKKDELTTHQSEAVNKSKASKERYTVAIQTQTEKTKQAKAMLEKSDQLADNKRGEKDEKGRIARLNQHIDLLEGYALELEKENRILQGRIEELDLELEMAYRREDEALRAFGESYRVAQGYAAKDKAMKIGLGVGVTLAVIGGLVGGYYAGQKF